MLIFSIISNFKVLNFGYNRIFYQTKNFETNDCDEIDEVARVSPCDSFRLRRSQYGCHPLIFEHFSRSDIFDVFDFSKKLTMGQNDLGEARESLSRLDLSIPRLDMPPTHAGNRRFCVKNRDFGDISRNLHI